MRLRVFFLLFALAVPGLAADGRKPNVVFILADDLGWTDLGCQGSRYYETPNIDRLAANGIRFTNGYTCGPNCQPTRAALASGQYAPRTGVYTVGGTDRFDTSKRPLVPAANVQKLPLDRKTVYDMAKGAGYTVAHFGKWHLGQDGEHHPLKRGAAEGFTSMGVHYNFATQPPRKIEAGAYLADYLTDNALAFIDANKAKPFFVALHHFGVHSPYEAKKELIERFKPKVGAAGHDNPVYAAMIASVDESVGRVVNKLEELKLLEDTLVVFSSDNGGVGGYMEAGVKKAGSITNNAPLRGGKGMLYEGGVRVPYIFHWKGKAKPGVCNEPILSVDLFPSMMELTGGAKPEQPLDGVSWVPLIDGRAAKLPERALYWHFPGYLGAGVDQWRTTPAGAIRLGDFKLIEFFEDNRLELYNLATDLGQKKDLSKEQPEKTKELHGKLVAWRADLKAMMPTKRTGEEKPAAPKKKGKKE